MLCDARGCADLEGNHKCNVLQLVAEHDRSSLHGVQCISDHLNTLLLGVYAQGVRHNTTACNIAHTHTLWRPAVPLSWLPR